MQILLDPDDPAFEVKKLVRLPQLCPQEDFADVDAILWDSTEFSNNGQAALQQIRSQYDRVPVLVLVSEKGDKHEGQALALEADEYLYAETLNQVLLQKTLRYVIGRKQAENSVHQYQRQFNELFENTKDILFTLDLEGKVTAINKAAEEVMGWSRSEALKMNIKGLVAPEHVALCSEMMRRILSEEPLQHFEIAMLRKDGRKVLLEASAMLLRSNGRKTGVQGIARDVTERRNLENIVRQSQKLEAVGRLSGGLAHDFNNLLCVISGHTELLSERLATTEVGLSNLTQIRKATDSATSLVRQLLAFSRRQVFHPQTLHLNRIVLETGKLLGRLIEQHIEIRTALDPALGQVRVDPVQIEQVIINLVLNARDAMPQGGKLTIETSNIDLEEDHQSNNSLIPAGEYVLLAITDTGCGMNEETQSRIFEPFFTTKELGNGTGLGLATVYGIIKQSCGFIWVYSEERRGTTFKVYLPRVVSPLTAAPANKRRTEISRGTETILIVEDAEPLRALTKEFLEESGYTVMEAANGEEAVELARSFEGSIDLLLTDVVMPKLGGQPLVKRMTQLRPSTRVLYMSGYPSDGIVQSGILARGVTLLEKPFTREHLCKRVRQVLDELVPPKTRSNP